MPRPVALPLALTFAATLAILHGCETPEAFRLAGDGSILSPGGGGNGRGGAPAGFGGAIVASTGGIGGSGGEGGAVANGGMTGGGGRGVADGGRSGLGGGPASSGGSNGGRSGLGGGPASSGGEGGGVGAGLGGGPGMSGGRTGLGGGPAASGGSNGGRMGMGGGPASSGGADGGRSGSGGGGGGGVLGTNPCAGICASATKIAAVGFTSGNLGLGASCYETSFNIMSGNCSNFTGRTLKLNGVLQACAGVNWPMPLPAKKNGGYCIDISAGTQSFASFTTF